MPWRNITIILSNLFFHAPWCPVCRTHQPDLEYLKPLPSFLDLDLAIKFVDENCRACFEPIWEDLESWSVDLGIKLAKVDVTDSPAFFSGRFMVTALPTIFHVIDGEFREFIGRRGKDDFVTFIEENIRKLVQLVSEFV
ncbi:thioredoxin-related transmembrane protein 1-like [Artemia franciscana]|uniref:thioredoxin-related transmembrane protein 1-like n=1 Tax=Artemia franciscana TaxID=6661 RepID=UPI0032DB25C0